MLNEEISTTELSIQVFKEKELTRKLKGIRFSLIDSSKFELLH